MNECNKVKNYAPIIIPTLCRYEHFRRCIESLSLCEGALDTDLYISIDYPKTEEHRAGYSKIVSYVDSGINGFKTVHVFKQKQNLGASANWLFLYEVIKSNYDIYIGTEDDNVFSPNFLLFVNMALEKYQDNDRIFSVSGYGYPLESLKQINTYYLYPAYSAWGVGLWTKRFDFLIENVLNIDYAKSVLKSYKYSYILYKKNPHILSELINMVAANALYGDTLFETYLTLEDCYSVFPTLSKTRNYGHDGSGEHCSKSVEDIYIDQVIDTSNNVEFEIGQGLDNKHCANILSCYKKQSAQRQIRTALKYLLYKAHLLSYIK